MGRTNILQQAFKIKNYNGSRSLMYYVSPCWKKRRITSYPQTILCYSQLSTRAVKPKIMSWTVLSFVSNSEFGKPPF